MIEVTQRDFQNQFFRLSKGLEKILVVGRGGVVVGMFIPGDLVGQEENAVQAKVAEIKPSEVAVQPDPRSSAFKNLKDQFDIRGNNSEDMGTPEKDEWLCGKCRKWSDRRWYGGELGNAGWEEVEICEGCKLRCKPIGFKELK